MEIKYRLGVIGLGFWAHYQVAAWMEIEGVAVVAVCDRSLERAEAFASKFSISDVYTDAAAMLSSGKVDFVDIVSSPETHEELVLLCASAKLPVVCQKPMAPRYATGKKMVSECALKGVPFYVHENFRWQTPMVAIKNILESGEIGRVFKARVYFNTRFPVVKNQPSLKELPQMILADLGIHLFDLVRYFFGEVRLLFCRTQRIDTSNNGEDVAGCFMETLSGVHCTVELSWASTVDYDCFPQTLISIEGEAGSISLTKDYQLSIYTEKGTRLSTIEIPVYAWANPDYQVVHSSIVACNQDIFDAVRGLKKSENAGESNLETLLLVEAAYHSANTSQAIDLDDFRKKC